jgi:predicted lipoprotein with Yx(FWY)xxD motif
MASVGPVLVDDHGLTLYGSAKEKAGTETCDSQCQTIWPSIAAPPSLASATYGPGIQASLVGQLSSKDGPAILTYGGVPLHTYAGDSAPGDGNGQGVQGEWFAVRADGQLAASS